LFAHPGVEIRNSAGLLGPGLDVRGDGGYIVAPGSIHPNGRQYRWDENHLPSKTTLAAMPPWLIASLTLCLLGGPLSAEPLRLVHEIDAEGALGAPLPPEAGVRLELREDGEVLGWPKGGHTLPDATNVSFGGDAGGAQGLRDRSQHRRPLVLRVSRQRSPRDEATARWWVSMPPVAVTRG
jgi:hypothetical protein